MVGQAGVGPALAAVTACLMVRDDCVCAFAADFSGEFKYDGLLLFCNIGWMAVSCNGSSFHLWHCPRPACVLGMHVQNPFWLLVVPESGLPGAGQDAECR